MKVGLLRAPLTTGQYLPYLSPEHVGEAPASASEVVIDHRAQNNNVALFLTRDHPMRGSYPFQWQPDCWMG